MKIQKMFIFLAMATTYISQMAFGSELTFCKKMFGSNVLVSFEPKESNGGGVAHNVLTGKATPIKIKGLKKPTGFVCLTEIYEPKRDKCPEGLHLDMKRSEFPVCISNVYPLSELCPEEISGSWPELKKTVCGSKKNRIK